MGLKQGRDKANKGQGSFCGDKNQFRIDHVNKDKLKFIIHKMG